ncbi:T3JAM protein, partial [Upupa epops]|nr:T3JAM protein [Upupa epops]
MISHPEKTEPRPRQAGENYEEKCERRHEKRENLRRRNKVTTCRSPRREAEEPLQSPRQREFLRRRNLASDVGKTSPGQEPKARVHSSQVDPRSATLLQMLTPVALSFQHPWSSTTFPPALSPLGTSAGHFPRRGASMNTQGPETLKDPSAGLRDSSQQTESAGVPANSEGLSDQLSPSTQEALHRELLLKQKMVILQELFSTLLQASEKSWQGQLNEDKLRCKLRALENQLQACTQSYSEECVKKILVEMEDQKQIYEQKAKEALQKMLEDKLQTEQQLESSQRSLAATREDLAFWKEHYSTLKAELTEVTTARTELENSFHVLQSDLQRAAEQKEQLGQALRQLQSEHAMLHQRASALREDNDLKAELISTIKDKLQREQKQKVTLEATISHLHNLIQNQPDQQKSQETTAERKDQVSTMQTPPPLTPAKQSQNTLLEHPEEEEEEKEEKEEEGEESLKDEMQKRTAQLTAKENECRELRSELEALSEEYRCCLSRLRQCRDELNRFQGTQAKRQRSHWMTLLVAVTAAAITTFLSSYRP